MGRSLLMCTKLQSEFYFNYSYITEVRENKFRSSSETLVGRFGGSEIVECHAWLGLFFSEVI